MSSYVGLKAYDMGFDAHMTLAYYGRMTWEKESKVRFAVDSLIEELNFPKVSFAKRLGISIFRNNTPVLLVEPEESIVTFREILTQSLPDKSEFSWHPHISLKLDIPDHITLPRVVRFSLPGVY